MREGKNRNLQNCRLIPSDSTIALFGILYTAAYTGGMGEVYRVYDTQIKEEVALKLIKSKIAAETKTIERFRGEIRLARKISHRSVCRMFDLGEVDGTHFITMEYVAGEDLKSLISRIGQMPVGKTLDIARQICGGLFEAHRLGIVHRDLKPGNIMIDKEGNAKIMDFGIARSTETAKVTGTGVIIGTPEYMSPEQAEAENVDQRSDIYSLGIILYEMVTGQVPFTGRSALSVAMKQKGEIPKDPQEVNPQVPNELSELILKCLAKEREERFETAEALIEKLDELAKILPSTRTKISKKKSRTSREVTVTFSPRKLLLPAAAALALLLVALFLWKPFSKRNTLNIPTDKPRVAVLLLKNNTGDQALDHFRETLSDSLIQDLQQSKYLYILPDNERYRILNELGELDSSYYAPDILTKIAEKGAVNYVIIGSYELSGRNFRISLNVKKAAAWENVGGGMVTVDGRVDEYLPMIDILTKKVKSCFNLSSEQIEADLDAEIAKITSPYPEALSLYKEGWKLNAQGDTHQGIEYMEKAVAIDPEFAMAFRALSAWNGTIGNHVKAEEYGQKAYDLSFGDRVSERERLAIRGHYFQGRNLAESIKAFKAMLEIYPDDSLANIKLAQVYFLDLNEFD
ncbi:MAG TPA: protein kinase [Candidatus Desulfaltia sp.]|nr:protein kinase [Candidatus Desulfaltia sp.]